MGRSDFEVPNVKFHTRKNKKRMIDREIKMLARKLGSDRSNKNGRLNNAGWVSKREEKEMKAELATMLLEQINRKNV